jgi:hypothetical protein
MNYLLNSKNYTLKNIAWLFLAFPVILWLIDEFSGNRVEAIVVKYNEVLDIARDYSMVAIKKITDTAPTACENQTTKGKIIWMAGESENQQCQEDKSPLRSPKGDL